MTAIRLNGVVYDGTGANPKPPSTIEAEIAKIGRTLVAADGTRIFVARAVAGVPIRKRTWKIAWEKADAVERDAVRALLSLATTFTYRDEEAVAYIVQIEEGDPYKHSPSFTKADNSLLYDLSFTIKEV